MAASDIYEVKESPWASRISPDDHSSRRRRRSRLTSSQAAERDLSKSRIRRSGNRGFRRLIHLMKKKTAGGRFWVLVLAFLGVLLAALIVWDLFFRYPDQGPGEAKTGQTVFSSQEMSGWILLSKKLSRDFIK